MVFELLQGLDYDYDVSVESDLFFDLAGTEVQPVVEIFSELLLLKLDFLFDVQKFLDFF